MITVLSRHITNNLSTNNITPLPENDQISDIQPHGILIVLRPDLTILQLSDNTHRFLGYEATQLLNQPLTILFPETELQPLQTALMAPNLLASTSSAHGCRSNLFASTSSAHGCRSNLFHFNFITQQQPVQCFQVVAHYLDRMTVLELEPVSMPQPSIHGYYQPVQLAIFELQKMTDFTAVLTQATKTIRYLSHFPCLSVYQFDPWGNAHLVVQDKASHFKSLLESSLPASIISKSVYQLTLGDGLQLIVDIGSPPVKLLPARLPNNGEPLCLRASALRVTSFITEKYLLDKNIKSLLWIPLFRHHQLWGLFVGQHYQPQSLNYTARKSCEMMASVTAFPLSTLSLPKTPRYQPTFPLQPQTCYSEEKPCCQKALEALHDSEQFYRSVINALEEGVILQNADGSTLALNASAERILGSTAHHEVQTSSHYLHWQAINEEGIPFTYQTHPVITTLRTGQAIADVIIGLCKPQGQIVWFTINSRPLFRPGHTLPYAVVTSFIDITERKQAQAALQKSEARLAEAQQLAHLGHWEWDLVTGEERCSEEMFRILGIPSTRFTHELFENALHPQDKERVLQAFAQAIDQHEPYRVEFRMIRANLTWCYIQAIGQLIRAPDGKPLRLIGTAQDITAQKQAENELQSAHVKLIQFKTILDMTIDCLFMIDVITLKFIYVNQGAINQMGYSEAEFLQMTILDILPSFVHADYRHLITSLLEGKPSVPCYETVHQSQEGRLIPIETTLQYVEVLHHPPCLVAIARDISERKRIEIQLQQAKDMAEKAKEAAEIASHAKSVFLANMSHELRTPLNAILGFAQILNLDSGLTHSQQEAIQTIQRGGEYLLTLINDILDISKIEAGRIELQPTAFHLQPFLQGVVDLFKMRAEQRGLSFVCQTLLPLPSVVRADEKRLRQVLINLLSNAVKFTQEGSVILKIGYQARSTDFWIRGLSSSLLSYPLEGESSRIRFQIEDSGQGLMPSDMERIFEPFQQAGDSIQRTEGTGLGLAITKTLVERMGGELHVESTYGQGSIFWLAIDLPEMTMATVEGGSVPVVIGYSPPASGHYKILIVDDREENRKMLGDLLRPIGFRVFTASSGQEGVAQARIHRPEVIFMDLMMPMMDGFEATRQIRRIPELQDTVMIAISASAFDHHRSKSLEVGCHDFIAKPIRTEILLNCLQKHLKLTWIYKQDSYLDGPTIQSSRLNESPPWQTLRGPTPAQATTLLEMATIGDIQGILEYVQQLEQGDEQFQPFAHKVYHWLEQLEMRKMIEVLEYYCTLT